MDMNTNKFSIVIPTMWGFAPFVGFLKDLAKFDLVDDIIIINNKYELTPEDDILHHPKIRMVNEPENTGVNPAWNKGVQMAKNSKVCILNDDVIFDLKMFYHVDDTLTEQSGVVGICPGVQDFNQPPFETGVIKVVPWIGQHTYGFGCLMFVHKSWWVDIPLGLTIYYGDNWIFDTCLARMKTNYLITDALFYTPYATSTRHLTNINEIHAAEQPVYNKAFAEFRAMLSRQQT